MEMELSKLKDLRAKIKNSSPLGSPVRRDCHTLYSDKTVSMKESLVYKPGREPDVIVLSESEDSESQFEQNDHTDSAHVSSEEDVTTTVMKMSRLSKTRNTRTRIRQSSSESDNNRKTVNSHPRRSTHSHPHGSAGPNSTKNSPRARLSSTSTTFSGIEPVDFDFSYDHFQTDEAKLVESGIRQRQFFSPNDCDILEQMIDDQIVRKIDTFKRCTVDTAPLRNKYFFGEGYTYGNQLERKGPGMEQLYPKGFVDPIPEWIITLVVKPLERAGVIPKNFVNSVVVNDYLAGGCIVSHIDPKQIFERPIITVSLMSESALSFGCKFSFKPIRCSEPVYCAPLKRGCVTLIG